jgi:hypothetical protein
MTMVISANYLNIILTAFKFAEKKSYCQIATVAKTNNGCVPKARTILLYYDAERSALYFTCSNQTQKWAQLQATPKLTGIYLDTETMTQYRFEADVMLIDYDSKNAADLYKKAWHDLRSSLRQVLWKEYLGDEHTRYNVEEICLNHGVVLVKPYYWDIFHLNRNDFSKSERTQMVFKNNQWEIFSDTSLIHPLKLID